MEPLHEFACETREEGEGAFYAGEGSEIMLAPVISPEDAHHGPADCALPLSQSNNWSSPFVPDRYQYSMMQAYTSACYNHAVYYPPIIHGPNLGPPYFGQQPCPSRESYAPPMHYEIEPRGSLSSFSSSDTLGSSRRSHGRNQRRDGPRRGGAFNSSSRGRCYYDENATFYQMIGRIVEIAQDRSGSKFIQRRLQALAKTGEASDVHEMQIAFNEVLDGVEDLWDDVYGNYILQAYLELGTLNGQTRDIAQRQIDDMRDRLGRKIVESDVFMLSSSVYGCRLVQKALDRLEIEEVACLVGSLKDKVLLLVHDHNGNHVIQRSIVKINEFWHQSQVEEECVANALLSDSFDIIISEVTANIKGLAVHPYGCRVVQRLIENCHGDQKSQVLDSILKDGLPTILLNHQYGNYVVQRILKFGRACDRATIFDGVNTNVLNLSKQKHSSNVVEMMLRHGNKEQCQQIIEEIIDGRCDDQYLGTSSAAVSMAGNAYANYVIKYALDVIEAGPTRERLFGIFQSNLELLQHSRFAKHIVLRVQAYSQESRGT